jgi:DNA ligase (NAD+)
MTPDEVAEYYTYITKARTELKFEIDGVVAKLNRIDWQNLLGYTAHAPRWAIAMKFTAQQAMTKLLKILLQVGRTGVLTPVAVLEPINVGGVLVARATLHNADEIESKDLRLGDMVIVQRAGDVIPEVVCALPKLRSANAAPFVFPSICPECGGQAFRETGEAAWRCINKLCPGVLKQILIHFASKAGLDVQGIGSKWIETLVDKKLLATPADLFSLTLSDLLQLERMGKKSAQNFIQALEKAKTASTLQRFICALGIRHVGEQTAKALADKYADMEELALATELELQQISDIGPEVSGAIVEFFAESSNKKLLSELRGLGLWPQRSARAPAKTLSSLAGRVVLFTGTLSMSRDLAKKMAEDAGAKVVSVISKSVNYLVAGEAAGSKLVRAQELNIPVIDESQFKNMLGSNPFPDKHTTHKQIQGNLFDD